jgi:hypothetical protein
MELHTVAKILKEILLGVFIVAIVRLPAMANGHTVQELPHLKLVNAVMLTGILDLIA